MAFLDTGTIMSPWYNRELNSGYISVNKKKGCSNLELPGNLFNSQLSCKMIIQLNILDLYYIYY